MVSPKHGALVHAGHHLTTISIFRFNSTCNADKKVVIPPDLVNEFQDEAII